MHKILIVSFLLLSSSLFGQLGMGEWRMFISPNKGKAVATSPTTVLAAFENGILEYDIETKEKSFWTNVNGLSDILISTIIYDNTSESFYIAYTNGNLDKWKNGTVTNMPEIKLSNYIGSKAINHLYLNGSYLYVSTDFSAVKYNLNTLEVKDVYYFTQPVCKGISIIGDTVYALSNVKLYKAGKNQTNLSDPLAWKTENAVPTLMSSSYGHMAVFNDTLYIGKDMPIYSQDTVLRLKNNVFTVFMGGMELSRIKASKQQLMITYDGGFEAYNVTLAHKTQFFDYVSSSAFPYLVDMDYTDGNYWSMDKYVGLARVTNSYSNENILFEGPSSNEFYAGKANKGKVLFAGGARDGIGLLYSQAGCYLLENEVWTSMNEFNQPLLSGTNVRDFLCVAIDPKDNNKMALGSYSGLPLSLITDGKTVSKTYAYNDPLLDPVAINPVVGFVSCLEYDSDENLWIANSLCANPLKMIDKKGVTYEMQTGGNASNQEIFKMLVDKNGTKWLAIKNKGVLAFNENKTPADPSDDKIKFITEGVGFGDLPSKNVTTIALDADGELWIGTEEGFAVLYNTSTIFTATSFDAQQNKLEIDGVVEIFLGAGNITDIEIDGGNRKWIAIQSSGLFLLNAAGNEIIQTITKENSPLLSNTIRDLFINEVNGELFIITDKGIVSHRIDASEGDSEYANVKVFPNPVTPDFSGPITIQGIAKDSDIKITDASGKLVYQTTSNGGTATWNGKTLEGERASSGVYLIWTAQNAVKGNYVGKVVFIK
jgi:hypothetical protein